MFKSVLVWAWSSDGRLQLAGEEYPVMEEHWTLASYEAYLSIFLGLERIKVRWKFND